MSSQTTNIYCTRDQSISQTYPNSAMLATTTLILVGVDSGTNTSYDGACMYFPNQSYIPYGSKIFAAYISYYAFSSGYFVGKRMDTATYNEGGMTYNNQGTFQNMGNGYSSGVGWQTYSGTGGTAVATQLQACVDAQTERWWQLGKYDASSSNYFAVAAREYGYGYYNSSIWAAYGQRPAPSATNGIRQVGATWAAIPGADSYGIWLDGVYQGATGATSWTSGYVNAGSHNVGVAAYFNDYSAFGNTATISVSATNGTYPVAPTISNLDSPIRKKFTLTAPQIYQGNDRYWFYVNDPLGNNVVSTVQASSTLNVDLMNQAAGTYQCYIAAYWTSDSNYSAFGPAAGAAITQPAISNVVITPSPRQIDIQFDRLSDAYYYYLTCQLKDGVTHFSTPYLNPMSGTKINYSFIDVKSGSHVITATPVYNNGYTGLTTQLSTSGSADQPVMNVTPNVQSNVPFYRSFIASTPVWSLSSVLAQKPSSFDFRLDGITIQNETRYYTIFSGITSGTHGVEVRAKWSDGDVSTWSSSTVVSGIIAPQVGNIFARQRQTTITAPNAVATPSGGIISNAISGQYYVATSTNMNDFGLTDIENTFDATRRINEGCPSTLTSVSISSTTSSILVNRPTGMSAADTWNVYISRNDRNTLTRGKTSTSSNIYARDIPFATTQIRLVDFVLETNQAKIGKVDLMWATPVNLFASDLPTSYKVERATAPVQDSSGGNYNAANWTNVTNSSNAKLYGTQALKFYENGLDSKWYFYRISPVYTNETGPSTPLVIF